MHLAHFITTPSIPSPLTRSLKHALATTRALFAGGLCLALAGCVTPKTLAQREADNAHLPEQSVEWSRNPDAHLLASLDQSLGKTATPGAPVSNPSRLPVIQDIPLTATGYALHGTIIKPLLFGEIISGLHETLGEAGATQTLVRMRLANLYDPRLLLRTTARAGEDYEALFRRLSQWAETAPGGGYRCQIRNYSENVQFAVAVSNHKPGQYHTRDYLCQEVGNNQKLSLEVTAFAGEDTSPTHGLIRIYRFPVYSDQGATGHKDDYVFGLWRQFQHAVPADWSALVTGPDLHRDHDWRGFYIKGSQVYALDLPQLWPEFMTQKVPALKSVRRPMQREALAALSGQDLLPGWTVK